ncbi:MAG: ZIP family metal transporter [Firmicutes bacterium]|nr:ZIP family metal transporter [Bacillota bacterium]MCL1953995.1 ZIP family metal transporter [Bacillota bacterium]
MFEYFEKIDPIVVTIIAGLFVWIITAIGAACVFIFKNVKYSVLNTMMGVSSGIMIAACFWSLLSPAIDLSNTLGYVEWLWPAFGFLLGGILIICTDIIVNKWEKLSHSPLLNNDQKKRSFLIVSSITLHNIPEGLVIGVAVGTWALGVHNYGIAEVLLLAIGIGIQDFPEGVAVAIPLRREGMSLKKSFFFGQMSGLVELVSALFGYWLATSVNSILPFALSFSAGAMLAVVASELLPSATEENKRLTTLGCILGFVLMMILDVALG